MNDASPPGPELDQLNALLRAREAELQTLAVELEETNRGVVALFAELEDQATLLRNANQLKDQFISHLSHEFRTPLNSITSLSEMLLQGISGSLNDEQCEQVRLVRKSAGELLEMVNDLLDLARIQAGRLEVRVEETSVQDVLSGLRAVLRPLATRPDVELVFEDASDLPPIMTDSGKLTQILRNLIANALKFTERGTVRISARAQDDWITIAVADTGIGIDAVEQERIFEGFTQVDSHIQREVKGTGLGLSLSRKLVSMLGGSLRMESELGRGSIFYVDVPTKGPDAWTAAHG